ncbi:hypothetical protein BV22DRAFT_1058470 [Leucogyrophana mollusca]|uniref:Uncharacterized protein n=1 Tax=Leucogyrophana mollusca TaxID=85980 RepID=A0ACB8BTG6_9AGAM|nr:hypothetical protein BV22DRAFT_1058470 [Leucogyrophana mollusca]
MSNSPTAYLLWSILSCLFFCFLVFHLWKYDRFKCLRWNSGRQPGAFKRVMTHTYVATLTLLVIYSVAITVFKFQEGYVLSPQGVNIPQLFEFYTPANKRWILPLLFILSAAWACEIITHLEELTFWLFLLHQGPKTRLWFDSWEFRLWLLGTVVAGLGLPLTALISRRQLDTCQAWIFLVGSTASTVTTIFFLYVLARFPMFIRRVKEDGGEPGVVLRLVMFYQLNFARVIFRFLFSIPLFVLALDGVQGPHSVDSDPITDFLLMIGGIGCFVSSAITLLIFFPRSLTQELGYVTTRQQPVQLVKTPGTTSLDLQRPPFHQRRISSPKNSPIAVLPSPHHTPSAPLSEDSHHADDATPEYQLEDSGNPNSHHGHSVDGHVRMRTRDGRSGHETPTQDTPYLETPYVFDRRSGSLVRPQSEGSAGLHPYVKSFRSPIDIYDAEDEEMGPIR